MIIRLSQRLTLLAGFLCLAGNVNAQFLPSKANAEKFANSSTLSGSEELKYQPDVPPSRGVPNKPVYFHDCYRITGSAGESFGLQNEAPNAGLGMATWQHDHQALSVAGIGSNGNTRTPAYSWGEFDLLYGYTINGYDLGLFGYRPESFYASFSTGIGFFNYSETWHRNRRFFPVDTTTYPPNSSISGVGLPIQVQVIYAPISFLGIGATLFGNINTKQINYGAAASLQVIFH